MSKFTCPVVRVDKSGKHPDAENLSIFNGPQGPVIYVTGSVPNGSLAAFIPRDSIVDTQRPEFSFLAGKAKNDGKYRIVPIKLRGKPSVGLLLPAPPGLNEGDDASAALQVTKWEPPQTHSFGTGAQAISGPTITGLEIYDVENFWNVENFKTIDNGIYGSADHGTEMSWEITEKVHGCNMKVTRHDGQVFIGSKSRWVADDGLNPWSKAWRAFPGNLNDLLDDYVVFGECYGSVQDLHYGVPPGENQFIVFDLFDKHECGFLPAIERRELLLGLNSRLVVPRVFDPVSGFPPKMNLASAVAWSQDWLFSRPNSVIHGGTIIEGLVIRPLYSEFTVKANGGISRLIVKVISEKYHQRSNGTEFK